MPKFRFKSLKTELLLVLVFIVCLGSVLFIILTALVIRENKFNDSQKAFIALAQDYSSSIKSTIETNLSIATTLSNLFSVNSDKTNTSKIDRKLVISMLKEILYKNKTITDVYMVWDANAYDKKDSLYYDSEFCDSIGRFLPLLRKMQTGEISVQPVSKINILKPTINTYLEPYQQRRNGKYVQKLPLVSPIWINDGIVGYSGIEIELEWLQNYIDKEIGYGKQLQFYLISNNGKFVAVSNQKFNIGKTIDAIFEDSKQIMTDLKKGKIIFREYSEDNYFIGVPLFIGDSDKAWQLCMVFPSGLIYNDVNQIIFIFSIISFVILIGFIIFLYFYLNRIIKPIRKLVENSTRLLEGELEFEAITHQTNNEIGHLNNAFIQMASVMKESVLVSESISKGDYSKTVKVKSEKDELAKAINKMNYTLKLAEMDVKKREQEDEIRNWVRIGISKIGEAQRQNAAGISDLASNILYTLVNYMNASIGGLFVFNNNNPEDLHLDLVSSFALNIKKHFQKRVDLGEGLAGACALEQKTIYLTEIPNDYIEISSGLGNAKPRCLFIVPLIYENKFMGVIELAFIQPLAKYQMEFVEQITENIAASIATAKINAKTVELLEQSQKQAEILAQKEQEVRQNFEKLIKTQEESAIREAEMKGILDAVNNTILTIEYTPEGILLNANNKYLQTTHYNIEEIKGVNVLDLVKDERDELKQIIEGVKQGKFYEKEVKRYTKYGEEKYFLSTYTPFYDINGEITKVMYFAIDNTERRKQIEILKIKEIELKQKIEKLEAILEDLNKNQNFDSLV